jgi:hypothetical protein
MGVHFAEPVDGAGRIRIDFQRLREFLFGLDGPAQPVIRLTQIDMRQHIVLRHGDGVFEERNGVTPIADLHHRQRHASRQRRAACRQRG